MPAVNFKGDDVKPNDVIDGTSMRNRTPPASDVPNVLTGSCVRTDVVDASRSSLRVGGPDTKVGAYRAPSVGKLNPFANCAPLTPDVDTNRYVIAYRM